MIKLFENANREVPRQYSKFSIIGIRQTHSDKRNFAIAVEKNFYEYIKFEYLHTENKRKQCNDGINSTAIKVNS